MDVMRLYIMCSCGSWTCCSVCWYQFCCWCFWELCPFLYKIHTIVLCNPCASALDSFSSVHCFSHARQTTDMQVCLDVVSASLRIYFFSQIFRSSLSTHNQSNLNVKLDFVLRGQPFFPSYAQAKDQFEWDWLFLCNLYFTLLQHKQILWLCFELFFMSIFQLFSCSQTWYSCVSFPFQWQQFKAERRKGLLYTPEYLHSEVSKCFKTPLLLLLRQCFCSAFSS